MKQIFDPKHDDEFILAADFENTFDTIDISKINYSYDLLGFLYSFKITKCGISCRDSLGNLCYFRFNGKTSRYPFYKTNFFYEED